MTEPIVSGRLPLVDNISHTFDKLPPTTYSAQPLTHERYIPRSFNTCTCCSSHWNSTVESNG
jgi:hypothetical protein